MSAKEDLAKAIIQRQILLFVGSGISARLGLPTWSGLISWMAKELSYDPAIFDSLGSYPALIEYYLLNGGTRENVAKFISRPIELDAVDKSVIHRRIVDLNFPIIYTTNYDEYIEMAFERRGVDVQKIWNGSHLLRLDRTKTQLVKFHGDVKFPASLVLTEGDYYKRLRFDNELDIKLRSDFQEYGVFFIGYSLNDLNLRNILYWLSVMRQSYSEFLPNSYIFLGRPNPVQERIFQSWGITPIVGSTPDEAASLQEVFNLF